MGGVEASECGASPQRTRRTQRGLLLALDMWGYSAGADAADSCNSGRTAGDDVASESTRPDCADGLGEDDARAAVFVKCGMAGAADNCSSTATFGSAIGGAESCRRVGIAGRRCRGISDTA